eukprot:SAG11_NODE_1635_length_4539_cov_2.188514_3_plen_208_part_00
MKPGSRLDVVEVDHMVRELLYWLTLPSYLPARADYARLFAYVSRTAAIANNCMLATVGILGSALELIPAMQYPFMSELVAVSGYGAPDGAVEALLRPCNLTSLAAAYGSNAAEGSEAGCAGVGKALLLSTARTAPKISTAAALSWDPEIGSLWWVAYFWLGYGALAAEAPHERLLQHLSVRWLLQHVLARSSPVSDGLAKTCHSLRA